jgi:hypothetical protein
MKILHLLDNQADFGAYFLHNGLTEVLGKENVVMYPPKLSYLGLTDKYYTLDDGKRGNTGYSEYIKVRDVPIITLEEICEDINSFDIIILSSPRTYAVRALKFLKKYISFHPRTKLVFTDHEDSLSVRDDIIDMFKPDIIFKRELTREIDGVYPLPFSSCVPYLDRGFNDQLKKLDIFASFGYTSSLRYEAVNFLVNEYGQENNYIALDHPKDNKEGLYPSKIPYFDYLEKIAQSKIALSIRGHGWDCVRRFEICNFETLMISDNIPIITPNPFEDEKHCIYFDDIKDLKEKIDYYLKHDDERIEIAKAGKRHLDNFHTNQKRSEYFLDIVKRYL